MTQEMIQEEGAEVREELTKALEDEFKKRADEFRTDETKMQSVREAAQRVYDYAQSKNFPIVPMEMLIDNFIMIHTVHSISIEEIERDLKNMVDLPIPEDIV